MVWSSTFERQYDTVVFGEGYAGLAAALAAHDAGDRVLLIGAAGDLVWESGRAFSMESGTAEHARWRQLSESIALLGGRGEGLFDGAIAEVAANTLVAESGVDTLYFARPIAVDVVEGAVAAVVLGTKSGVRRVSSARWIDATETADLIRLVDPSVAEPLPDAVRTSVYLQHPNWEALASDTTTATMWPSERRIVLEAESGQWREAAAAAVADLAADLGDDAAGLCVSHQSFVPMPIYRAPWSGPSELANVVAAVPAATAAVSPADRFLAGVRAVEQPVGADPHAVRDAVTSLAPRHLVTADVAVVGVGTGGVVASLAASRDGARVVGVEALGFVGGVGTGGGIHSYWFGAPGGLQAELDARTHERMAIGNRGPYRDGPFNPWAKQLAADAMLAEESVDLVTDAIVFAVEREADHVVSVDAATPQGVVRISAKVFIDGTGDGDVCAAAGAEFTLGRESDGLLHAYSQSSGRLRDVGGQLRMAVVNFDVGYVDPTDVEDWTRGRVAGVSVYDIGRAYSNIDRPTYIAPVLGLRQGRQVVTDTVVKLDDLIRRRRFPDAIGYTASHLDSHGTDFEFDSDELMFWVWLGRAWGTPVASEIPLGALLPTGLSNVVVGSRCLGVSQDAHYAVRMQRDMQRVGEAAGRAAAAAVETRNLRAIDLAAVQAKLVESTALGRPPRTLETGFGAAHDVADAPAEQTPFARADTDADLGVRDAALARLDAGEPGDALWWLYRHPEVSRDAVLARLEATDDMVSWFAAGIVAMWGMPEALPRLHRAITDAEYGFGEGITALAPPTGKFVPRDAEPMNWQRLVPNWLTALALLRRCGTQESISVLQHLAHEADALSLNTTTTMLLTLKRLLAEGTVSIDDPDVADLLAVLAEPPAVGVSDYASRVTGHHAEAARTGSPTRDWVTVNGHEGAFAVQVRQSDIDMAWQPELILARIRARFGGAGDVASAAVADERRYVRAAFEEVR